MRIKAPVPLTRSDIINSMGFRVDSIRTVMVRHLDRAKLIDAAVHLQLTLQGVPKGLTYMSDDGRRLMQKGSVKGLHILMSVTMDPQLGLDQSRVDALLSPIRSADGNYAVMGEYTQFMANFITHHQTRFGMPPSPQLLRMVGQHCIRIMMINYYARFLKEPQSRSDLYCNDAVAAAVVMVDNADQLSAMMSLSPSQHPDDVMKALYSFFTEVPFDWVNDDAVSAMLAGKDNTVRVPRRITIKEFDMAAAMTRVKGMVKPQE